MKNKSSDKLQRRPIGHEGYTLVELLVVLAILSLLIGLAAPRMMGILGGAKRDTAEMQVAKLGGILDLYRLEVGRYPANENGLRELVEAPASVANWNGPYLQSAESLVDPWGAPYIYRFPGEHGEYDLYSLGADGKEGGDDDDADIASW